MQSAADPQHCRVAGPGVTKAVAGQRAELVIEVEPPAACTLHAACRPPHNACHLMPLPAAAMLQRPSCILLLMPACNAPLQARDDSGGKRLSGGDEFQVALQGPAAGERELQHSCSAAVQPLLLLKPQSAPSPFAAGVPFCFLCTQMPCTHHCCSDG